eukprot:UN04310
MKEKLKKNIVILQQNHKGLLYWVNVISCLLLNDMIIIIIILTININTSNCIFFIMLVELNKNLYYMNLDYMDLNMYKH